jgi:hypothetical protein
VALVDPEVLSDKDLARIYIAGRRAEAQRVEACLSGYGIDYTVAQEPFRTRLLGLLPVEYQGLAFYVLRGQAEFCRQALTRAGLVQGLAEDDGG